MKPIIFPGVNVVYAEDQTEYLPLPVMRLPVNGNAISCWQLTKEEIDAVNETGCIFLSQWTFNQPLQPVLLTSYLFDAMPDGCMPYDKMCLRPGDKILSFDKVGKQYITQKFHHLEKDGTVVVLNPPNHEAHYAILIDSDEVVRMAIIREKK